MTRPARLYHRIMNAIGLARLTLVDDAGPIQKAQADLGPHDAAGASLNLRDNVFRLAEFGFTSNPPAGADALLASLGGDPNQGVIIATGHRLYRLVGLASGDAALYDAFGHHVWLSETGIHILGDAVLDGNLTVNGETVLNGPLTVVGDTAVTGAMTFTGDMALDGALTVTDDITDRSGTNIKTVFQLRQAYSSHVHTGVQAGGATSGGISPAF